MASAKVQSGVIDGTVIPNPFVHDPSICIVDRDIVERGDGVLDKNGQDQQEHTRHRYRLLVLAAVNK